MTMTTFDDISNKFASTVNQTKEFIRSPLFLRLIGDVRKKHVADFGCGDGYFTRMLALNLPASTVGVDYSESMLKIALEKESARPQNIEYVLDDIRTLKLSKSFDIITAVYLLDYAESKKDLLSMIRAIYNHLRPSGKFCAIVPHPNIQPMKEFEFERRVTSLDNKKTFRDGDVLRCEIKKGGTLLQFNFIYWSKDAYNKILTDVGFKDIVWVEPFVSKEGIRKFGAKYWNHFLKKPSSIGFTCHK